MVLLKYEFIFFGWISVLFLFDIISCKGLIISDLCVV